MKNVQVITLGCYKNLVDSERVMQQLELNGFKLIFENDNSEYRDFVIINTCGFIHDAKTESINTILEQVSLKNHGKRGKLIVFGCLSQRYKDLIKQEIPEVDYFFGKFAFEDILKTLNCEIKERAITQRTITTPAHYSYLKISDGCNRKCAFCAIPLITGRHKSTPIDLLVKEANFLASQGVKEIILIAQDLNQYGNDLDSKSNLYELINRLSDIETIEWIRLQYLYPKGFPKKLPLLFASNPKLCNYIDIPFQHASNKILKRMLRGHTYEDNIRIINELRSTVPDISIRTTLITGFPGETSKDFDLLLKFVEETRFDLLGAFSYTHEDSTTAVKRYNDTVSKKVKNNRLNTLMTLQQEISLQKNLYKIGTIQRVIIDSEDNNSYSGHNQYNSPEVDDKIIIPKSQNINIQTGSFYDVKISDARHYDLIGDCL